MTGLGKKVPHGDFGGAGTSRLFLQITSELLLLLRCKLNVSFKARFDIKRERNTISMMFIAQLEYTFHLQFHGMVELSRDV